MAVVSAERADSAIENAADISDSPFTIGFAPWTACCETNCVLSVGFRGSWFCSCATSSCRNISSVGADAVAAAVVDAAPVEEDPVNALTADAIIYSLRLFAAGGAVFHLLAPTGPVRLALPPLAFLLMRPGIRL